MSATRTVRPENNPGELHLAESGSLRCTVASDEDMEDSFDVSKDLVGNNATTGR